MSCPGRKQDSSWQHFTRTVTPGKQGCRATCKSCNKEMQGLVARMKDHLKLCTGGGQQSPSLVSKSNDSSLPPEGIVERMKRNFSQLNTDGEPSSASLQSPAKKMKNASMSKYVHKITASEKKAIDLEVAKMIFATNSPFNFIEHPQVIKVLTMLLPGYVPPSRHALSTTLLDEVHGEAYAMCKEKVKGKAVSMEIDGWSNVHNEPVVCSSITTYEGDTFLTSTIDTQDERHTGVNLEGIAEAAIMQAEEELGCEVKSLVTDNAANMRKCRSLVEESHSIVTHPCSAHVIDRLAKDVDNGEVKSDIVTIAKYFRNHHVPSSLYKKKGGKKLSIPNDTRWNSVNDCLQDYVDNWPVLVSVVESHPGEIDPAICEKVLDINLKRQTLDYLSKMKPLAVALDKLQRDSCHLADAVVIWKELAESFDEMSVADSLRLEARMKVALTPAHFLAYHLDPRYFGSSLLTPGEVEQAMNFLSEHKPSALSSVINYQAKSRPFGAYMFKPDVLKDADPLAWWKSQESMLDKHILSLVEQLFTARASTAGIERIFSTFGLVHSKLRNRLHTEKAAKLVFLYKLLNI